MNLLDIYTPAVMTEAVKKIKPERQFLTERLGVSKKNHRTRAVVFDVVEGRYDVAPMGFPGDPATIVNMKTEMKTYSVTAPQVYLDDKVDAEEINDYRAPGEPFMTDDGELSEDLKGLAQHIGDKQQNLLNSINRRIEWQFAQVCTTGKIEYTDPITGRTFSFDYGVPDANIFTADTLWTETDDAVDPVDDLDTWGRYYAELNGFGADLIIAGKNASDALFKSAKIRDWLKNNRGDMVSLNAGGFDGAGVRKRATISGIGDIMEYIGSYTDASGATQYYVPDDALIITSSRAFELHYGPVVDLSLGVGSHIVRTDLYSKLITSDDGKQMKVLVESHPLVVLKRNTGILCVTVSE